MSSITTIDPYQFYDLVKIAEEFKRPEGFDDMVVDLDLSFEALEEDAEFLSEAYNAMLAEARRSTRRAPSFKEEPDEMRFEHVSGGTNFVALILHYVKTFHNVTREVRDIIRDIQPVTFLFLGDRALPTSAAQLQEFSSVINLNSPKVSAFSTTVGQAYTLPKTVIDLARGLTRVQEAYYQLLVKRHSIEGIKIQVDPVRTDLALCLYENIDGHGEVAEGKKIDEISAYSMRKAELLADTLTSEFFQTYLKDPGEVVKYLKDQLLVLWDVANQISKATKDPADKIRKLLRRGLPPRLPTQQDFKEVILTLEDLDPQNIDESDKVGILSPEEKVCMDFRNETLLTLSSMLGKATSQELVRYVLSRKEKWHIEQRDVNSFYVCRIGSGNAFGGEAPGMLEVVPGIRPRVNLDEVVGQGFDEVRAMINHAKNSSKWTDLFMATSPSKKVDKMNVLLVGPMGCGKTEALRALGSDEKSIGIFAQASDFLTCWRGEQEKNPKRLFEAGLRLQKEADRQVFFLIDEIDTILNGDRGQAAFGGSNLATEFQILMDGITTYPGLAVWGATNHPERIPMPLLRRFAKVIVVGELTLKDRIELLRRFTSYLPLAKGFDEEVWADVAKMLDGAVGDTVRKVTDHVWREKMFNFVNKKPGEAEGIIKYLQEGDVRFDPSKATAEWRVNFHDKLRPFVQVTPGDLLQAAQVYLDNPAIKQEIKTAVETYKVAKEHLVGMVTPRV